ncbi:MAG: four helix bundle protein, partial [Saprospiraceae bacterium]|nr:four helix bundle protein [Saprospiraceae bacterium]
PLRKFRFEDLEIWQLAIDIGNKLFDLADILETRKLFRFAEQLRGCGMSLSNNIAEGSGSYSHKEFKQFLNYSRRSCFECANIIIILLLRNLVEEKIKEHLFENLDILSRKITTFQKSLNA